MIKDYAVGSNIADTLVVKAGEIRLTSAKKPYLWIELTDGESTIQGNHWDWKLANAPQPNTIVDVSANVTTWQGTPQLKISNLIRTVSTKTLEDFAPKAPYDTSEYVVALRDLIDAMSSEPLRYLLNQIFMDIMPKFEKAPAAKGIHHAYPGGLLKHSVDVAYRAHAMCAMTDDCNEDLVTAGGLLHDVGKLETYKTNGVVIDYTYEGMLLDHLVLGIQFLNNYKTPENANMINLLNHLIVSHHGMKEWGSPVTPKCVEAYILHYCDNIDAKVNTIAELEPGAAGDLTKKEWALDNSQMFTRSYINGIMSPETEELEVEVEEVEGPEVQHGNGNNE